MKQFTQVACTNTNGQNELLVAILSSLGFDSFHEVNENELTGYIEEELFDWSNIQSTLKALAVFNQVELSYAQVENKNWNAKWEESFQPIIIDKRCTVKAPFHSPSETEYTITISPKMAFGTGHHATTYMMLSFMLTMDFKNMMVLDFGCGTGILSILASYKGASNIFANDIEQEAFENAQETTLLNNCKNITIREGGIEIVPEEKYNIILANVNTLAIMKNLKELKEKLKDGGIILLSGILDEQESNVKQLAEELGLSFAEGKSREQWVALKYTL